MGLILIWPVAIIGLFILIGLRIVDQYERGVVLTLGNIQVLVHRV